MTETVLGEVSSWPLRPIHDGKPLPSDHVEFVFEDPAAPVHDRVISDVFHPRVFAYAPKTPNGRAALVLAGGGYTKLVVGKEGVEVAEWLASLGFHAFVLVHRFPCERFGSQAPVDDAIEAMRQIRARATEFGIDAHGIGVCGLSSGGHLAACLATKQVDAEARPDFLIVGYAPISTNASGRTVIPDKPPLPPPEKQALYEAMQPDAQLADNPPPTFIVYAANDDVVPVENAYRLHKALLEAGGKAELHVFANAPHGFALREKKLPVGQWPELFAQWFASLSLPKPLSPGIHIILGDSAAGTFRRVFRSRDRLLIDQDVLCCGPTPRCDDLRAWSAIRLEYWRTLLPMFEDQFSPSTFSLVDSASRLRDAERITVWAATSLSEQLFVASVVHLVDVVGADPAKIALVQFETLRNRSARVLGMGELNEKNMSEHPEPALLSAETIEDYRAAWVTLTSEDPTGFERFADDRPNASRWLKQAMQLILRRFPDIRSGLTHWDFKLLQKVREQGPKVARVIGYTMVDAFEDADLTGDGYLFGRLLRLGSEQLPKPLVALSGNLTNMRGSEVALTPFGLDVLEGRASNYPTNPIEDLVAGVGLSSVKGAVWFNDGGKLVRG